MGGVRCGAIDGRRAPVYRCRVFAGRCVFVVGLPSSSAAASSLDVSGQIGVEKAIPASRARAPRSRAARSRQAATRPRAPTSKPICRAPSRRSPTRTRPSKWRTARSKPSVRRESDLQAERAARAADLSVLGAQSQLIALRAELDRARTEIMQLRTALESERLARVAAEAALGSPVPPGDLTELASQQTEVAASAPRRSPEEADRLVAALEAAANSLRATVPSPTADDADG